MSFDISKYRAGYSLSVGGVVLCDGKALLVHRALGTRVGDWVLPGGYVEADETAHTAVCLKKPVSRLESRG